MPTLLTILNNVVLCTSLDLRNKTLIMIWTFCFFVLFFLSNKKNKKKIKMINKEVPIKL